MARKQTQIYPRLEARFEIPNLVTDPFDFEKTEVRVQIRREKGESVSLPAFFDGNQTWRVRHTPTAAGLYRITSITLNGKALQTVAAPREWTIKGAPNPKLPGFVRLDARDPTRFCFDNGTAYYPLGHNQAWQTGGLPDIPVLFDKMGAAGENWSRVWMNHWDGKNLDWLSDGKKPGAFGTLSLDVARRWDTIVSAAERNGIAFQLVTQHHGQYSTTVNSNWSENPYNFKNGGFLATPNEFFTNPQAKNLTKRKLRYTVARWGYSPAILAWELFNEVQFTDAARAGQWDVIAAWHREMAAFLREQDPYRHLITTSSTDSVPLTVWTTMDFYQEHTYPADVVSALGSAHQDEAGPRKPFFIGEFGPSGVQDPTGTALHAGLWAGIMSGAAGAPQFWTWDDVERHNLYAHFRGATSFIAASGLAGRVGLQKTRPPLQTATFGSLKFGPGAGWGPVKRFNYEIKSTGPPEGVGELSSYLHGTSKRDMQPEPLTFRVDFQRAGQFVVQFNEISGGGAHVILQVNDQKIERDFPAGADRFKPTSEAGRLALDVPAGKHTITLQNSGSDWAAIESFTLTSYAPILGAYGVSSPDFAAAWVYHRENLNAQPGQETGTASGEITLEGLAPGRYRATWWDTLHGTALSNSQNVVVKNAPLKLQTPSIARDAGLFLVRETPKRETPKPGDSRAKPAVISPAVASPAAAVPRGIATDARQTTATSQPISFATPETQDLAAKIGEVSVAAPANAASYRDLAAQTEANLRAQVLDQWFPRAVSNDFGGGFDQNFSENWTNTSKGERSIVYQARLTWLASQAALRFPAESTKWKLIASHGADFLRTRMWDAPNGGFFWEINAGTPGRGGEKHAYGHAFAIYALAAHFAATGDRRSLQLAQQAFRWLDLHAHDARNGGYFEAFSRDGRPILTPPTLEQSGDFIGTRYGYKSMNTHIHLLEALAALHEVVPEPTLKARLGEVFGLVRDTIVVSPPGAMNLFFRLDWKALPDHDSYGHDIETAFLLVEAARALGMPDDAKTWQVARALVDHTLDFGLDTANGGFYDAGGTFGGVSNPDKVWWVQAEALNALLLMHARFGAQTSRYWDAFTRQWAFVRDRQIDKKNGGWLGRLTPEGQAIAGAVKSDGWTEGYHQGRALLTVTAGLRMLAGNKREVARQAPNSSS